MKTLSPIQAIAVLVLTVISIVVAVAAWLSHNG